MMRIVSIYIVCVLVVLVVAGCGDDSDDSVVKPGSNPYRALTVRDNVLFNLEKSWNDRNLTRFDELLDDAFVFHFNVADVGNGEAAALQWDRLAEMAVAGNMFDPDFSNPDQVPVIEIFLSLWYPQGDDSWKDVLPDQDQYPGETWHSKVFWYDLKVKTDSFSYIALNLQATAILRQPDGDGGIWQIVSWSDDTGSEPPESEGTGSYAEGNTWGTIKTLYDEYRAPTVRDEALFNLEKSWNERRIDRYNDLLDDDFVFHFSAADFTNGHVSVPQWDRLTEMGAAGNMFDPNFSSAGQTPVSMIDVSLTYAEGEDLWTDVLPDQDQYPGETWYSKVFTYTLTVNTGEVTYVANNIQATAIVRQSDGEGGVWRIATWSDDTAALLNGLSGAPALTEETTWGAIKTLYAN